jgi:hypothetical protein
LLRGAMRSIGSGVQPRPMSLPSSVSPPPGPPRRSVSGCPDSAPDVLDDAFAAASPRRRSRSPSASSVVPSRRWRPRLRDHRPARGSRLSESELSGEAAAATRAGGFGGGWVFGLAVGAPPVRFATSTRLPAG